MRLLDGVDKIVDGDTWCTTKTTNIQNDFGYFSKHYSHANYLQCPFDYEITWINMENLQHQQMDGNSAYPIFWWKCTFYKIQNEVQNMPFNTCVYCALFCIICAWYMSMNCSSKGLDLFGSTKHKLDLPPSTNCGSYQPNKAQDGNFYHNAIKWNTKICQTMG